MQPNVAQGRDFSPDNGAAIVQRLSRAFRPRDLADDLRRRRRHPSDLAGIGLSLPAGARRARRWRAIADFLRGGAMLVTGAARARRERPRRRPPALLQFDPDARPTRARCRSATTSTISCRSANTCRSAAGSSASASPSSCTCPAASTPATGADRLHVPGLPDALAMICYEAIFPNECGERARRRRDAPRWMLNVTDDAWFGLTAGPTSISRRRGCARSRLGLPLVRAANTGISAVVDGRGPDPRRGAARRRGGRSTARCPSRCRRPGSRAGDRRPLPVALLLAALSVALRRAADTQN